MMRDKGVEKFGDNMPVGMICLKFNKTLKISFANRLFYQMLGYTKDEFYELYQDEFAHIIQFEEIKTVLESYLEKTSNIEEYKIKLKLKKKDGSSLLTELLGNIEIDSRGEKRSYIAVIDILDRKNFIKRNINSDIKSRVIDLAGEEILEIDSQVDELTGCLSRVATASTIKKMIKDSVETEEHVLILIDIDNFNSLISKFSNTFGDKVLKEKGAFLKKIIRNGDVVGRVGADKFVVFLRNISNFIAIKQKVEEIVFIFKENGNIKGEHYIISSSVGVALFKNNNCTYKTLYEQAITAVNIAKSKGKNQYSIFGDNISVEPMKGEARGVSNLVKVSSDKQPNILLEAFRLLQIATNIPETIQKVLELVGKTFDISRAFIIEISDDRKHYDNTYEWCEAGIEPLKERLQHVSGEDYGYIASFAGEDGIFACNDIEEIDGLYYDMLVEQGVKSFLQGYLKMGDVPQLLIGIDDCVKKREWSEDEILKIIYLTNLIGMSTRQVKNFELVKKFRTFKYLSEKDKLTGAATKEKFFLEARALLKNNPDKKFLFFLINVNKFQTINSFFGMEEGDRLLKVIARNLKKNIREVLYTFGRIGGDIFCGCQELTETCDSLLTRKVESFKEMIVNYRPDYNLSISFGAFEILDNNMPLEVIYSKAFMAAKKIKRIKETSYLIFEEEMEIDEIKEQSILNDIFPALIENQFHVYLQPKISLISEAIIGAEALIRWIHPVKGFIAPSEFIPALEKNGLIIKIDYFVWETVFTFLKQQKDNGEVMVPISVNISRVDLFNKNLVECFEEFLVKYDIEPKYLHIEITESAYTENYAEIIDVINKLKDLGFHIEMDDFGTGYSSLNMFSEMVVDTLKLDMKFLENLHKSGDKHNILSFIISLAKHFGLPVVAEGIETEEQLRFLKDIGCDSGQGFYFAKPMPMEQFSAYLKEKSAIKHKEKTNEDKQLIELSDIMYPDQKRNHFYNNVLYAVGFFEYVNREYSLIRCNETCYEVLGVKDPKLLFKENVKNIFHVEDRKTIHAAILKAKRTGESVTCYARILRKPEEVLQENPLYHSIHMRFRMVNSSSLSDIYLVSVEDLKENQQE